MLKTFLLGLVVWVCLSGAASAADRNTAEALLAGVPALETSGDFKTVEDLCRRSLTADDSYPLAHYYLALCLDKSSKGRDAFKEYQTAATLAKKERELALVAKAEAAAKRIGAGLLELDALDVKLAEKLPKIAAEAMELGKFDVARQAYVSLLALQPGNAKAKEGLEKANKAIAEHIDPIKARIASAMLAEVWHKVGVGKKDEAIVLARNLSRKYPDTEWGRDAADLIDRDFVAPKKEDLEVLAQKFKESGTTVADNSKTPPTSTPKTVPGVPTTTKIPDAPKKTVTDVESLERRSDAEAKKMPKEELVAAFDEAQQKGRDLFAQATPGSEGNQENLAKALEQFIKAESLFARIEAEQLKNDEISENATKVSMLRYACMKMFVLSR